MRPTIWTRCTDIKGDEPNWVWATSGRGELVGRLEGWPQPCPNNIGLPPHCHPIAGQYCGECDRGVVWGPLAERIAQAVMRERWPACPEVYTPGAMDYDVARLVLRAIGGNE